MRVNEAAEIRKFFYNESVRLENEFIVRYNYIKLHSEFDNFDLLEFINLLDKIEYLKYIQQRVGVLLDYLKDPC